MSDQTIHIDEAEIEAVQKKHKIAPLKPINLDDFNPLGISNFMAESPAPLEFVFTPALPTQGIAWIYAATGIGKTLFTLNLAYAIAAGGNFLKYSCPKPRKVLYIDGEMPFNQLHDRVMKIVKREGELDYPENLSFITPDKLVPFRVPKIDDEEGQFIYKELILKNDYEVIVFDNLSMLSSFDENKSHEWKPIQDWLLHLRAMGKTLIIVHHAGKDKNGYRGTSRMLDCADAAISLQPVTDEGLDDDKALGKKFKIVYQKNRVFGGLDAQPYEVQLFQGVWSFRSLEVSVLDRVVECVNAKMSQRDIAKELFISQTTVNRLYKKALKMGRIIT